MSEGNVFMKKQPNRDVNTSMNQGGNVHLDHLNWNLQEESVPTFVKQDKQPSEQIPKIENKVMTVETGTETHTLITSKLDDLLGSAQNMAGIAENQIAMA